MSDDAPAIDAASLEDAGAAGTGQEPSTARYADVALPLPMRRTFTYALPDALAARVVPGSRVAVPFSGRKLAGVVTRVHGTLPEGVKARAIAGLLEEEPLFDAELLAMLTESAEYYLHPIGEVLRAAAPALRSEAVRALRRSGFLDSDRELSGPRVATRTITSVRLVIGAERPARLGPRQRSVLALLEARGEILTDELADHVKDPRATLRSLAQKGLVELEAREVATDPFFSGPAPADAPHVPTPEQAFAIGEIVGALRREGPSTFLLHGITGSGKTEVYLRAIAEARAQGKGALLLVPEIALTPQLVSRFRARFGDAIAVLHSGLGDRERALAWRALRSGALTLAIGARSAIFAPVRQLGIVVVDEEHDPSYKQEEGFRYHARDLAILRAHRAGAVCVLGSATPSLESWSFAREGRHRLLSLPARPGARGLPEVELVDLSKSGKGPSGDPRLTTPLHRAIETCLAAGEQAILFLNRRGFSPSLRCEACGEVEMCPACSVPLTEHRRAGLVRCHYCDYAAPVGSACSKCGQPALVPLGLGTEKLEDTLQRVFAPARIARLDRDTATGSRIEDVLDRVRRREVDILVGTQMVTKGHDLPGVTLVGVILADQSLAFPDFRAAERTFQLLTQVAGRAGRGDRPGHVIVQTYQPQHPAILAARKHDFVRFAVRELEERRELGYAPFGRLVAVRIDHGDPKRAQLAAEILVAHAREHELVRSGRVDILGPAPAPIERVRGRWRWRALLRGPERPALRRVAMHVLARIDEGLSGARASLDVDPVSML
ncbi:MAG: primosomal protein N' [Myxococcota bacterium]|nr:primosomal protein N' [Myxococcota bacterium]